MTFTMKYLLSFRTLILVYAAAAVFASVEIAVVRDGLHRHVDPNVNRLEVMEGIAETYNSLYPQRPTSHYVLGAVAFKKNDRPLAREHFELALAMNGHQENVLYDYSVNLVLQAADPKQINEAIENWRWHYPKSPRPDPRLAADPRSPAGDTADYLAGIAAFRKLRFREARRHFEKDLAAGSDSEQLFYNYALTLLFLDEEDMRIDSVIGQWRSSYPNSNLDDPRPAFERAQSQMR